MNTDTQRLDWLQADVRSVQTLLSDEGKPCHWSVNIAGWKPTLREAIDAAILQDEADGVEA